MLFLLESMRKALFWRRKMAAWRAKLDDGDMCCSCFGTTKYTCLKCKKAQFAINVQFLKKFIFWAHDLTLNREPRK